MGLSTLLVSDRRSFALLAKGFIVDSPILVAKSGENCVFPLLVKILDTAGCVIVVAIFADAKSW